MPKRTNPRSAPVGGVHASLDTLCERQILERFENTST